VLMLMQKICTLRTSERLGVSERPDRDRILCFDRTMHRTTSGARDGPVAMEVLSWVYGFGGRIRCALALRVPEIAQRTQQRGLLRPLFNPFVAVQLGAQKSPEWLTH
jgi:hypothetical protein